MIIENCEITKSNAEILIPYIGSTKSGDYKRYGFLHDGITLKATNAYSPCFGTVVSVGQSTNNTYTISIQYNAFSLLRICNLSTCNVKAGQAISTNTHIGTAKSKIKVEYATNRSEGSASVVRVDGNTYYKHDPSSILASFNKFVADNIILAVPDSVKLMLSNNRG